MAKAKVTTKEPPSLGAVFGFSREMSVMDHFEHSSAGKLAAKPAGSDAVWHIFGSEVKDPKKLEHEIFGSELAGWQQNLLNDRNQEALFLAVAHGPAWLSRPKLGTKQKKAASHRGQLESSGYATMRDRVGAAWPAMRDFKGIKHLAIRFHGCTNQEVLGVLTGIEIVSYKFTSIIKNQGPKPSFKVSVHGANASHVRAARAMGTSINLARHLVNVDPQKLNPLTYAESVLRWFKNSPGIKVDVWGPERLAKENMHLHLGVGQGASQESHMVHIKYRPTGKPRFKQPVAIVGKGVTFDSGGLDIKPPSGMRLMKKDMGGSASVVGLAHWLSESESDVPCDFYLALAENAVDKNSFHPGDVITSRSGISVEIHNTDAEGRLVLADVMDVAQTHGEKPCAMIDLATLTGAMRVAVGTEIAGFFANHDGLADLAERHGAMAGDPCWRLPLWDSYKNQLKSSFADLANASDSGFAGAITAALFLQKFVKDDLPWLHFDLHCWSDRAVNGDVGGNGQGIQMLAGLLDELSAKDLA